MKSSPTGKRIADQTANEYLAKEYNDFGEPIYFMHTEDTYKTDYA